MENRLQDNNMGTVTIFKVSIKKVPKEEDKLCNL